MNESHSEQNSHDSSIHTAMNREGALFVFFILGLGASGIYSGQNGLLLLFCCLATAMAILTILARRNLSPKLKIERRIVEEIFAKRDTRIDVLITNTGDHPVYGLHVFERFEDGRTIGPMFIRRIDPGETATARYMCQFQERGNAAFPGFQVRSRFPFAFIELRRDIACEASAFVYPEPLSGTNCIAFNLADSEKTAKRMKKSESVIRELIHGRKSGRILWKLSARRQTWIESVHRHTRASSGTPSIVIVPKTQVSTEYYERQISQITGFVLKQIQNDQTGMILFGQTQLPYGKSPTERRQVLEMLSSI